MNKYTQHMYDWFLSLTDVEFLWRYTNIGEYYESDQLKFDKYDGREFLKIYPNIYNRSDAEIIHTYNYLMFSKDTDFPDKIIEHLIELVENKIESLKSFITNIRDFNNKYYDNFHERSWKLSTLDEINLINIITNDLELKDKLLLKLLREYLGKE